MNIKDVFISLTSRTYPHGTEKDIFNLLPIDILNEDEFGNLFIKIGESDVMFTSHLDTATSALTKVNHVFEGNIIKTDGKSILGADDKAGVTIMLYMIERGIPGLYYFFIGEEVGCIGSKKLSNKLKEEKIEGINKVISFDRRGTNSVITYQSGQRCTSDKFADALALELNKADNTFSYKADDTGVLTDSIQFVKIYSECTNISVGYQSEHTFSESQDIEHLEKLAIACTKVDWNGLPVERDPSKTEYKSYYGYYGWDYYDYKGTTYDSTYDSNSRVNAYSGGSWSRQKAQKTEKIWFFDKDFNYVSNIEIEVITKKYVKVDLSKERIENEKYIIEDFIKGLELDYVDCSWDGMELVLNYGEGDHSNTASRNDLLEYIPELDYRKIEDELETLEFTD